MLSKIVQRHIDCHNAISDMDPVELANCSRTRSGIVASVWDKNRKRVVFIDESGEFYWDSTVENGCVVSARGTWLDDVDAS